MDRMERKFYGVPVSISRFNPCRLLPLGNFKEYVYATKPQTLEGLRDQIEHVINDVPLATSIRYVALFDVIVGSVLWQVDILNMYGLKEV